MTLREANAQGFLHRERTRYRAGASRLLGIELDPAPGEGSVVDVGDVDELHRVVVAPNGAVTIGAFAPPEALEPAPHLYPPAASASAVRTRLALHDARVTIYGLGRTRTVPIEGLTLASYELPAVIEVPAPRPGLGIADRRIVQREGATAFALGVTVALRVSLLGRFEHVRILVDLDENVRRANDAEAKLEKQRCERDRFPEAARLAASCVGGNDARSNAAARALVPLVMAALRDAFTAARGNAASSGR
jgi:CO/xanthine dehydrogenase FAD-binding subunit